MSHRDAENLVRSVKDRLKSLAKKRGEEVQIVLMRYALERWLYRLSQSDHQERFVLKGAMLFALWSEEPHRATKDLDLLGFGEHSIAALETVCREICRVEVADDGLQMLAETVTGTLIRAEDEYEGVRLTLVALLGRAASRCKLILDLAML